jgi:hypothetical protein
MLTVKKQRPRLLSDLPPDLRKLIEHIQIDSKGNMTPQRSAGVFLQQDLPPGQIGDAIPYFRPPL